jgi:hypothetical protein
LRVILYGFWACSTTLREERRLRVSENRVLRKKIGPTRDEETGKWRKLNSKDNYDPYLLLLVVSPWASLGRNHSPVRRTVRCILGKFLGAVCHCFPYYSPNIISAIKSGKVRWAGHVARMGNRGGVYRVLIGKPE